MKKLILPILAVLTIVIGAYLIFNPNTKTQITETIPSPSAQSDVTTEAALPTLGAQREITTIGEGQSLKGIGLGNSGAPVIIHEFSSYSCGHCGTFHKNAYKDILRNYLATDQAYLIMNDFPLNLPALEASAMTQCVPVERFAQFSQLLFENQGDWAFEGNHSAYLTQNAQLMGLSAEDALACLENEESREAIAANAQTAQQVFDIRSTPSFVIYHRDNPDDRTLISGAHKFEVFQEAIEKYLK